MQLQVPKSRKIGKMNRRISGVTAPGLQKQKNGKPHVAVKRTSSTLGKIISVLGPKEAKEAKIKEEENAAKRAAILAGDTSDLPPVRSNIIRVFLSSTFAGMTLNL